MKVILSLLILLISLEGNAFQLKPTKSKHKVKLQLKWQHQFQFAGYYAAINKGIFAKYGIEVELIEAKNGADHINNVFSGKADFGISNSEIIRWRAIGKPAVVLASIFQHSPQVIIGTHQSGTRHVHDLVGKRVMINSSSADIMAYLVNEGVNVSNCKLIPHNYSMSSLINDSVDAATAYITDEPFLLQQKGIDYSIISPISGGIDFYGDILFTTEELIHDQPELVDNFTKASLEGWEYAMSHPNEIIDLIISQYSRRHTKPHLEYEAREMKNYLMQNVVRVGYINEGRWKNIADIYKQRGLIHPEFTINGLLKDHYQHSTTPVRTSVLWLGTSLLALLIMLSTLLIIQFAKFKKQAQRHQHQNITFRAKNKELTTINKNKDTFFAIIAHDLKSPFGALLGLTNLHLEGFGKYTLSDHQNFIQVLQRNITKIYELTENLLTWARSHQGLIEYEPQKIEMSEQLERTVANLQTYASKKKLLLEFDLSNKIFVHADRNMLDLILRNLTTNALKFTPEHGNVTVKAYAKDNEAIIQVIDNGIGMTQERIDNLFQIQTADSTVGTNNEKGTGLGLILCKEFVDQHHGRIWADSIIGQGSTFSFSIPLHHQKS